MNLNKVGLIMALVLFGVLMALIILRRVVSSVRRENAPTAVGGMQLGVLHAAAVATAAGVPGGGFGGAPVGGAGAGGAGAAATF